MGIASKRGWGQKRQVGQKQIQSGVIQAEHASHASHDREQFLATGSPLHFELFKWDHDEAENLQVSDFRSGAGRTCWQQDIEKLHGLDPTGQGGVVPQQLSFHDRPLAWDSTRKMFFIFPPSCNFS